MLDEHLNRDPVSVSVIIPTLNEAAYLGATLDSVGGQSDPFEVVVADGGSADETIEIARLHGLSTTRVLHSPRGRARQMNAGAAASSGDVILFLHADTRLEAGAFDAIRRTLGDPTVAAGAFRLAFDARSPMLDFYAMCSRIPMRQICFGDRGIFVKRDAFEAVGGYAEIGIFEDLDLVRRLARAGRIAYLSESVVTASRRFRENGIVRQQVRNARLWLKYLAGTNPQRMAHLYPY